MSWPEGMPEDFNPLGFDFDLTASADQSKEAAKSAAAPFASFYTTLKEGGVDTRTAGELTCLFAAKVLGFEERP